MNAGRWLILGVFGVAVIASTAAWVHRYYRTDYVRELWGVKQLDLIANAPQVSVRAPGGEKFSDVTRAAGMLSIRYMLSSDFTYTSQPSEPEFGPPYWTLRFTRGREAAEFAFSDDCTAMHLETSNTRAKLVPAAAANLRSFFNEQFVTHDDKPVSR